MATVDRDEGAVDTLLKRLEDAAPDTDELNPSPNLPPASKPCHAPAPEPLVDAEIDETELIEGEMGGTASEVADEDVVDDAGAPIPGPTASLLELTQASRLGTQDLEIAAFTAGVRDETAASMEGARETSVFAASVRETAAATEGAGETAAAAMVGACEAAAVATEGACEAAAAWAANTTRDGVMCEGGEGGEAAGIERDAPGRGEFGGLSSSNSGMGVLSGWCEEALQVVWCEGTRKDERGGGESSSNRGTGVDTPRRCFEGVAPASCLVLSPSRSTPPSTPRLTPTAPPARLTRTVPPLRLMRTVPLPASTLTPSAPIPSCLTRAVLPSRLMRMVPLPTSALTPSMSIPNFLAALLSMGRMIGRSVSGSTQ